MDHGILVKRHLLNRFYYQFHGKVRQQMPSHYFTGSNVFYNGQVNKTIAKWDVGDVGTENLARNVLFKLSIQLIFECSMIGGFFHDRLVEIFSPDLGNKAVFFHYSDYLFMVHGKLLLPFQIHSYLAPTVFGLAFVENLFDQQVIRIVFIRLALLRYPLVVSAA
jgi:hypothetical protein